MPPSTLRLADTMSASCVSIRRRHVGGNSYIGKSAADMSATIKIDKFFLTAQCLSL